MASEILYYELAVGAPGNRGIFIPTSELGSRVEVAGEHELYRSMYMYHPEVLEQAKVSKTIKG